MYFIRPSFGGSTRVRRAASSYVRGESVSWRRLRQGAVLLGVMAAQVPKGPV